MLNIFKKKPIIYASIEELPVFNWFKIHETENLSWLIKNKEEAKTPKQEILLNNWLNIYDEYLNNFGFNESFNEYLNIKRELEILKIDYSITGDEYFKTFIEIKTEELEKRFNKESKTDYYEVKAYVEKFLNFKIDIKTTSVKEYYNYLLILAKENEKTEKLLNKTK